MSKTQLYFLWSFCVHFLSDIQQYILKLSLRIHAHTYSTYISRNGSRADHTDTQHTHTCSRCEMWARSTTVQSTWYTFTHTYVIHMYYIVCRSLGSLINVYVCMYVCMYIIQCFYTSMVSQSLEWHCALSATLLHQRSKSERARYRNIYMHMCVFIHNTYAHT